jgi:hypothetical protein
MTFPPEFEQRSLTKAQHIALYHALLPAFTINGPRRFVKLELDARLEQIPLPTASDEIVLELWQWLERHGFSLTIGQQVIANPSLILLLLAVTYVMI